MTPTRSWIFLGLLSVPLAAQNIERYRQFNHPAAPSHGYGVAAVGGSIYVASVTNGPVLWKYDQAGNQIWERDLEPGKITGDAGFAVAADAASVYIVGVSNGLPGQPQIFNNDAFIRKYDPDGNEVWTRLFGSVETRALGVALDSTGVYVAGFTDGALPGQKPVSGGEDIFIRK